MTSNWDQMVETFDELGLKKDLLRGIIKYNVKVSMDTVSRSLLRFNKKPSYQ
jgi:hypothetical protein